MFSPCPTLCNPMDRLSDSSVHEILQARIPEWVAIPFSREFPWSRDWIVFCIVGGFFTIWATKEAPTMAERYVLSHSCCVWLFASLWTIARLAIVASKKKKKKTWGPGYCLRAAHCSHCSLLISFKLGWASVGTTIPQREPRFQQAMAGVDDTPTSQLSLASISASSPQKPSQDCICRSKVSFFFFFPALGLHCCS